MRRSCCCSWSITDAPRGAVAFWGVDARRHAGGSGGAGVERLVADAGDGTVQFHFAARDGVCGDGHSYYRPRRSGYYSTTAAASGGDGGCLKGPVRAV